MIKYTIQEIIDWVPSFSLPPFSLLVPSFSVTEADTDPKERFVSFKVTTSNESSLFVPLQSIAPESSWLGGAFLKDYKNICKIKMRGMKTK